jgi:hypothetical protein
MALALWAPQRAGYGRRSWCAVGGSPRPAVTWCHPLHARQRPRRRADPRSDARYQLRCRRGAGCYLTDAAREHAPGRGAARVALADRRGGRTRATASRARSPRRRAAAAGRDPDQVGSCERATDSEELARQLDTIQEDAVAALEELRALAHAIYPGILHDLGPAAALRSLAPGSLVPIQVIDAGTDRSSDAIEAAIYFCAREAIQNTAKHPGPGATITVTLGHRDDSIEFRVSDDGAGMPAERDTDGIGITACATGLRRSAASLRSCPCPGKALLCGERSPMANRNDRGRPDLRRPATECWWRPAGVKRPAQRRVVGGF